MVQTAFRLPEELLDKIDAHIAKINKDDPMQRYMNRSGFVRLAICNTLKEKGDE
tara:strand:+ start:961 stop:1122 length:162 start_codon:yes stop_codon:yes gene_type:complete